MKQGHFPPGSAKRGRPAPEITDRKKEQYEEEGYFILENVMPATHLAMLREECDGLIEAQAGEFDDDPANVNHRDSRYCIAKPADRRPRLREFLFGELAAEICRATIGGEAFLFTEHFFVKAPKNGMEFSWHQDSGYISHPHRPYVTCWCALDDMTEGNGTVFLLPYSRAGTRKVVPHVRSEKTKDLVADAGDEVGIPVLVPAGSIAVFSSVVLHRSGANTSDKMRRAYIAQYSPEPILDVDKSPAHRGIQARIHGTPFLSFNGKATSWSEPAQVNGDDPG